MTLDTHLTFTQHCNNIVVKVQQRNNVLKTLADSTWGCNKETLLTTYQAIGRSILSYCCHVWTPSLKDTNWSRLQRAQNSALRITTGCFKMADVAEVHQEAQELPVCQHSELISRSEWKLPLCGRITYRHCRQPKLSNFLYLSNRLLVAERPMPAMLHRLSASVCLRYKS